MADPLKTRNVGNHPDKLVIDDRVVFKTDDLRYGTNPSQTAALYNPYSFLGSLREHKSGKGGPSQTNMEDILYAALSVRYFDTPSVIIMKHENPSGFATQYEPEPLSKTYRKARDTDFRASFGGTVMTNRPVDMETAEAMSELFTEVLVAPEYDENVIGKFKGSIRIFQYNGGGFNLIPHLVGDAVQPEARVLPDGSVMRSDVFLSPIRSTEDLGKYIVSERQPTERELADLMTAYRLRVRSNSVRMVKDGYTTALGIGQQDRVVCIEIADFKNRRLEEIAAERQYTRAADYNLKGSSMASDGFFPFPDSIELANKLGITAVLAPHGGRKFEEVLAKINEYRMAFVDLPGEMRFFDHH